MHWTVFQQPTFQEFEVEYSEEGKRVRGVRSSLALEIYGLQREQHVYFSNQEYYKRLEELRNAHLRNMAELEKMYLNQDRERHGEDREATSIRLDMSNHPLIKGLDFHIKLLLACLQDREWFSRMTSNMHLS